ncbi:hypothetical protein QYE76_039789 [Lolium multiflorum]|uniref:Transposon protein, putative, CACTA, En/Spm sub-class n=1 Tax=Lolium multiflorum TaxID=4521 RepID=A0AAD8TC59_LOLMU|nr:hypothetical protein QYE76_039789 [Lolium multiflorum]
MIDGGPGDPVDGIKEKTPCDLLVVFRNMSVKVAVGYILPAFGPEGEPATWHGNEIPAGYARVGVDSVVPSWETLELEIPGGDGGLTLREVLGEIILWEKKNIRLPGWVAPSTSRPSRSPSPPPGDRRPPSPPPTDHMSPPSPHGYDVDHDICSPSPSPAPPPPPTKTRNAPYRKRFKSPIRKMSPLPKVPKEQGGFDMEEAAKLAAACDVTVEELMSAADAAVPTADIVPQFVYGADLVSKEQLHKLPTHMRNLHQWYLDACKENIRFIVAHIPREYYYRKEEIHIEINELWQLFNLDALDKSLMSCYCLLKINECKSHNIINIGFVDPDKVNVQTVKYNRKETGGNLLSFHWILLDIKVDKGIVEVRDPLSRGVDGFRDLQKLLQVAWTAFKNHHKQSTWAEKLTFTPVPCPQQPQGTNLCGYYVCESIRMLTTEKQNNNKFNIDYMRDTLQPKEHLLGIAEELAGLLHGERGVIMEEDEEGDDFIDETYLDHFGDTFMEDAEGGEGEGEGEEELGCTLDLLRWKAQEGVADSGFENLLKMLKNMFPKNNELPASTYEAKKVVCPLGLEVLKIHACINDCILYRGEYENLNECPVCTALRYKIRGDDPGDDVEGEKPRKRVPAKVMWYAPIIPRLKRLFRNKEHAKLLRWHKEDRKSDGELRHPADGTQWRKIDREFKDFAADARNIRFGLSTDGMNPFGEQSSSHSTWPVTLCIYNLPPWLCMKRKFIMMPVLIQGPKQPGNDIDVYLRPLVDELLQLWGRHGVRVWDEHKEEEFDLRALLFVTINDWPALSNLSGQTNKGYNACTHCLHETESVHLPNCKKNVYLGHRRFLPKNHNVRKKGKHYNGKADHRPKPAERTGAEVFDMVKDLKVIFGKGPGGQSVPKGADGHAPMWKKKSIFWELEYWKVLDVRSAIDVMHVTKNICVNLLSFLGVYGKTNDTKEARQDQQRLKDPDDRHPEWFQGRASYALTKEEKVIFFECLSSMKVPSGFSSNIKGIINMAEKKFQNLKSHDCHVIMTQLLPIALRGLLPENVINPEVLPRLQNDVVQCLVSFEHQFPPSFFNIMTHLLVHLVEEISILGPVFLHNMFPFERFMGVLKKYVRNRARPEGSIAKGYGNEEVIEFCVDFVPDLKPIGLPRSRHEGRLSGKGTIGRKSTICMDGHSMTEAHHTVLTNSSLVAPSAVHVGQDTIFDYNDFPRVRDKWEYIYTIAQDKKSTKQNSGVRFDAATENGQKVTYYGYIEEIWELDYGPSFKVPLFRCKWFKLIGGGVKVDQQYGMTMVDFNNLGYLDEPFVLAKDVAQVFYVKDMSSKPRKRKDKKTISTSCDDPKRHIVLSGKRNIVGVEDKTDMSEDYNMFGEIPPFKVNTDPSIKLNDEDAPWIRHNRKQAGTQGKK